MSIAHACPASFSFFIDTGFSVAFKVYDLDNDGFITNGELFVVLKMMVGNNLTDVQLQQIVDKTILQADKDRDGKISFNDFLSVSCLCAELICSCLSEG